MNQRKEGRNSSNSKRKKIEIDSDSEEDQTEVDEWVPNINDAIFETKTSFELETESKKKRGPKKRITNIQDDALWYYRPSSVDDSSHSEDDSQCSKLKYKFAYDLQKMDENPKFGSQVVIAIELSNDCNNMSWEDLKRALKSSKQSQFLLSKPRALHRCVSGQVYVFDGFKKFIHFSVGKRGFLELTTCITFDDPKDQIDDNQVYLRSYIGKETDSRTKKTLDLARNVAMLWVPTLLQTKKTSTRVPYQMNFGFTDMK